MKSLKEYILEGGKAVNGTPMTQTEAKAIYDEVVKKFLPKLGLTKEGVDYIPLGSFGKKNENELSGDIDIAVYADEIAIKAGISLEDVENYICEVCEKEGLNYVYGKSIHVISFSWPFTDRSGNYGQVDIMATSNIDFSKWMYYSPDFRKAESKYKGLYRNQLIMAILKNIDHKILKTNEKNEILEYERYALRLNSGLIKTRRSFEGKKGNILKNEKALKEFDKHVTNIPEEIVKIAFGDNIPLSKTMTFEDVYDLFMSEDFLHSNKRENILKSFIKEIKNQFPVPSEIYKDWPQLL